MNYRCFALKNFLYYLIAPAITIFVTIFYFFDGKVVSKDLIESLYFLKGDRISSVAVYKFIAKEGLTFCSQYLGYPQIDTNCFTDYAVEHSFFQFLIVRILGSVFKDPFELYLYTCLFTNVLIAISANFSLRRFGVEKFSSCLLAILFTFTINRIFYSYSITIGNYYSIPLVILSAFWVYQNKVILVEQGCDGDKLGKYFFKPNIYAFYCLLILILALTSSAYYGYAFIIIYSFLAIINYIKFGKVNKYFFSILTFIVLGILIAILIVLPTIIFWIENGYNMIIDRHPVESSMHSISIGAMLIPKNNHLISSFADFSKEFMKVYGFANNEKSWQQIGFLSSFGFCSLLIMILSIVLNFNRRVEHKFYGIKFTPEKYEVLIFICSLNFLWLLFFTSEGFYVFLSYYFSIIRGLGRLNIIFTFLAFIFIGILVDQIIQNACKNFSRYLLKVLFFVVVILSFFDVAGSRNSIVGVDAIDKNREFDERNLYHDYEKFVHNIEESLPQGAMIFMMPVKVFPEASNDDYASTIGYIFSKELKFSYPMPRRRKSYLWQREVANLDFKDFITEIRKKGFAGVWVQRNIFPKIEKINLEDFENNLQKLSINKIESKDKNFVFYDIRQKNK